MQIKDKSTRHQITEKSTLHETLNDERRMMRADGILIDWALRESLPPSGKEIKRTLPVSPSSWKLM